VTPYYIALAWNGGLAAATSGRSPRVAHDYAERASNLAAVFSAGGNCTVSGTQVHLTGAGSCTVTASQDGDANTNAAVPVARTFQIGKADQQITFDALANTTVGDPDFAVSATASSNLAVALRQVVTAR
jgi:hypothetical protein